MRDLISASRAFFTANVGRCETCMRQSLTAAVAVWGVFGLGLLMWPNSLVQDLIGLMAFGLTALWMLHVGAYAARAEARGVGVDLVGRRRALGVLLRAAGVGVVASVPALLWPTDAFAFCGQCTKNDDCGVGFDCKNTAAVNSGKVCNECVAS